MVAPGMGLPRPVGDQGLGPFGGQTSKWRVVRAQGGSGIRCADPPNPKGTAEGEASSSSY